MAAEAEATRRAAAEEAAATKKASVNEIAQTKIPVSESTSRINNLDNEINKTKAKLAELNTTISPSTSISDSSTSELSSSSNLTPISTTESSYVSTQMDTSEAIQQNINVSKTLPPQPPRKPIVEPVGFMDYFTKVNYFK